MKQSIRKLTATSALLIMALGAATSASADVSPEGQTTGMTKVRSAAVTAAEGATTKPLMVARRFDNGLLGNKAHERHYLQTLAERYAPDTAAAWKEALEARKQAEASMPSPAPLSLSFAPLSPQPADEAGETGAPALTDPQELTIGALAMPAIPLEGAGEIQRLEAASAPPIELQVKESEDGKSRSVVLFRKALPAAAGQDGDTPETSVATATYGPVFKVEKNSAIMKLALPASWTEEQRLGDQLAEALDAGNEGDIRAALSQLLDAYQKKTAALRELTAQLAEPTAEQENESPSE